MTDAMTQERDFSDHDEPRNSRGQTLAEYIETLRNVYATLKSDLFFHMACKRRAVDVTTFAMHEKRIASISDRIATARKRASFYGIRLALIAALALPLMTTHADAAWKHHSGGSHHHKKHC